MANDAKRVSQLGVTTSVSANDRLVVLTNPATAAQTQTISVNNFIYGLVSNTGVFPIANSTQLGVVKVDGATIVAQTNGVISVPYASANVAGSVKIGNNVLIDSNGFISVSNSSITRLVNNTYSVILQSNGVLLTSGDVTIPNGNNLNLGVSSITANGYSYLPNGLLMQWGSFGAANSTTNNISFPVPFPTAVFSITVTGNNALSTYQPAVLSSNNSKFGLATANALPSTVYWKALGK